jgi:hypothetical protein
MFWGVIIIVLYSEFGGVLTTQTASKFEIKIDK